MWAHSEHHNTGKWMSVDEIVFLSMVLMVQTFVVECCELKPAVSCCVLSIVSEWIECVSPGLFVEEQINGEQDVISAHFLADVQLDGVLGRGAGFIPRLTYGRAFSGRFQHISFYLLVKALLIFLPFALFPLGISFLLSVSKHCHYSNTSPCFT